MIGKGPDFSKPIQRDVMYIFIIIWVYFRIGLVCIFIPRGKKVEYSKKENMLTPMQNVPQIKMFTKNELCKSQKYKNHGQ